MVVGTHTKDFADQNPHLISTIRDFSHIYETQEKETASRILWAAYFISVIANDKNPFKNLRDDEERRLKIKEEFCKVYSNKYLNLEKIFSSIVLSKEHQLYNIHLRKYEEFGWHAQEIDGHNFQDINNAINLAKAVYDKPSVIIARTIPGKGVKEFERDYHWHGTPPNKEPTDKSPNLTRGQLNLMFPFLNLGPP
jgi:hypothetical protein